MKNARRLAKPLLWFHLFLCIVILCIFTTFDIKEWMGHVWAWAILTVQFTWGLTVGLIVGPSRKRRRLLKWSLLLSFIPLWLVWNIAFWMIWFRPFLTLVYLAAILIILGCETFCGVLLGVKLHSQDTETGVTDGNGGGDNGFV